MKYLLCVCAIIFSLNTIKADSDSDARAALAIANANAKRMAELEKDVAELKAKFNALENKKEVVAQPQVQWVQGNVPGMNAFHLVPSDSPFAIGNQNMTMQPQQQDAFSPELKRMRQFQFQTPRMTGGVCVGPNCPGR